MLVCKKQKSITSDHRQKNTIKEQIFVLKHLCMYVSARNDDIGFVCMHKEYKIYITESSLLN